jgi:3-polyprenyl-4-hydroxybenzoate decarboxylase
MWALSTRVRGESDVILIPATPGMPLDPTSDPPGMGSKLIIDATTPVAPEPPLADMHLVGEVPGSEHYAQLIAGLQAGLHAVERREPS